MDARRLGGVLVLLCGLASSASVAAGAMSVDDARLVVRGVQRPAGRQAVALDLVVTPPPATRLKVAATLHIGTVVLPLPATIARNGRLRARAQRADLASVLPDFGSAHVDLPDPIGAVVDFSAADCVAFLRGRVLACPATIDTTAPAPDGVYDALVDRVDGANHSPIAPALGVLRTSTDGSRGIGIDLSVFDSLSVNGTPDGSLATLTGYAVTGGDIVAMASGAAASTHDAAGARVEGSVTASFFGSPTIWSFTLRRPDTGTPSALGGTWTVTFAGGGFTPFAGSATLDVTLPADGHATTAPTTVVSGGSPVLSLDGGTCQIAPGGALSCFLPSSQMYGIAMDGTLDVGSGTGGGTFYLGSPPSIYSQGNWTAAR